MQVNSNNALKWLILSAAIIFFDWLSKAWALSTLTYQQSVEVIPGFWNWTLAHNRGAAFSFLAQAGGWQQWLFSALAVIISVVCVLMLKNADRRDWQTALPLALIIGGALGNLIDRIRFGYVIDFVHWYYGSFHWPVFNLADSAISIAAVLLIMLSFKTEKKAA